MSTQFPFTPSQLTALGEQVLDLAASKGATDAQVFFSQGEHLNTNVRQGRVVSRSRSVHSDLSITVYFGKRSGNTVSSDFSPRMLQESVEAACNIARFTGEDECSGLSDSHLTQPHVCNLQLWNPWSIDEPYAIALAHEIEKGIHSVASNVSSDGSWVYAGASEIQLMTSRGINLSDKETNYSLSAKALGRGALTNQLGFESSQSHSFSMLDDPFNIGQIAGKYALEALNVAPIPKAYRGPVLFDSTIVGSLIEHFVASCSGSLLYNNNSFLSGKLGETIFSEHIFVHEDPLIPQGLASRAFDGDGIQGIKRDVVSAGILKGYFLSDYSARKMGMASTGNSWGPGNLIVRSTLTNQEDNIEEMLKKLNTGLLVTDFTGGSPWLLTGDYSRSVKGFWVNNGQIQHAVDGATISGNLQEMFRNILALGSDLTTKGTVTSGSMLIDNMNVAG